MRELRAKIRFIHNEREIEAIALLIGKSWRILSGAFRGRIVEQKLVTNVE